MMCDGRKYCGCRRCFFKYSTMFVGLHHFILKVLLIEKNKLWFHTRWFVQNALLKFYFWPRDILKQQIGNVWTTSVEGIPRFIHVKRITLQCHVKEENMLMRMLTGDWLRPVTIKYKKGNSFTHGSVSFLEPCYIATKFHTILKSKYENICLSNNTKSFSEGDIHLHIE